MQNRYYKYLKLLVLSSFSFFAYHFINTSSFVREFQIKADTHSIKRGFSFLVLTGIMKYFFLTLGICSLLFLIYIKFKKENNAY